jgi:hypothetical protein
MRLSIFGRAGEFAFPSREETENSDVDRKVLGIAKQDNQTSS